MGHPRGSRRRTLCARLGARRRPCLAFVSPSAVAGHPGWRLSASVPAREFTRGEIVGVSLERGVESHDLRGGARSVSSVAFDGRRGTWRVDVGSSLAVRMTIAPSAPARPLGRSFDCRGRFMQAPVVLRGRFTVRTGTRFFGTIRRSRLAGTIVFNTGGSLDCSPLPTVCAPSTRLIASRGGDSLNATRDGGGYLGVSLQQAVRGAAWYHRLEFRASTRSRCRDRASPFAFPRPAALRERDVHGDPDVGADSCGIETVEGTLTGSFRARASPAGRRARSCSDRATSLRSRSSGARPSG